MRKLLGLQISRSNKGNSAVYTGGHCPIGVQCRLLSKMSTVRANVGVFSRWRVAWRRECRIVGVFDRSGRLRSDASDRPRKLRQSFRRGAEIDEARLRHESHQEGAGQR